VLSESNQQQLVKSKVVHRYVQMHKATHQDLRAGLVLLAVVEARLLVAVVVVAVVGVVTTFAVVGVCRRC
jgi:hypothetical protein